MPTVKVNRRQPVKRPAAPSSLPPEQPEAVRAGEEQRQPLSAPPPPAYHGPLAHTPLTPAYMDWLSRHVPPPVGKGSKWGVMTQAGRTLALFFDEQGFGREPHAEAKFPMSGQLCPRRKGDLVFLVYSSADEGGDWAVFIRCEGSGAQLRWLDSGETFRLLYHSSEATLAEATAGVLQLINNWNQPPLEAAQEN